MANHTKIAPPNSLVLLADASGGQIPGSMERSLITSTGSCIAIGCLSETDGETEFTLGVAQEVDPGDRPAFHGNLNTPARKVVVRTVLGQTILEMPVPSDRTDIRIWVNDPMEPDRVIIGTS